MEIQRAELSLKRLRLTGAGRCGSLVSARAVLCSICAALYAQLGRAQLYAGRVYTEPERIYVNQPFEIMMELEVGSGLDIDNIRVQGFPNNPEYIAMGNLQQERVRRTRRRPDGAVSDVLIFKSRARCLKPLSHEFTPVLSCDVVERRSRGFFSTSSSVLKRMQLTPFTLTAKALPAEGKPVDFSGAVGRFTLNGVLSRRDVRPGDLITLALELSGEGWLNNAAPPSPPASPLFKSYPPREILREENRIRTEQIVIPTSTNAVLIAPAAFTYFNPDSGQYETCRSAPFELRFISAEENFTTNQVMVIDAQRERAAPGAGAATISARQVNRALHKIRPVVFACLTLLAACFVFLSLKQVSRATAVILTLLIVASGGFLTSRSAGRKALQELAVTHQSPVHLAPSPRSAVILSLPAGTQVIPLEHTDGWTRIEAEERTGWIKNEALTH